MRVFFRVCGVANFVSEAREAWVLARGFNQAVGRRLNSDVRAGFPVARAQIDPNAVGAIETRLSLAVAGDAGYYLPIPVTPDQVGNFIQPGDHIDLIVPIGSLRASDVITRQVLTVDAGTSPQAIHDLPGEHPTHTPTNPHTPQPPTPTPAPPPCSHCRGSRRASRSPPALSL